MERHKQNEMVWAQNPINSRNDGERKNHTDDGEQTAATTIDGDVQSRIYELAQSPEAMRRTMALVSCSRALSFPRNRFPHFTHDNDEKSAFITTKQAINDKRGLTMTVNTGRLRQEINNHRASSTTWDHEGQDYVSFIVVAALQEAQSTPKVLHVRAHD